MCVCVCEREREKKRKRERECVCVHMFKKKHKVRTDAAVSYVSEFTSAAVKSTGNAGAQSDRVKKLASSAILSEEIPFISVPVAKQSI